MKMKEFGPPGGGARPWRPPLDPPMDNRWIRDNNGQGLHRQSKDWDFKDKGLSLGLSKDSHSSPPSQRKMKKIK